MISDKEMAQRRAKWRAPAPRYTRGYGAIFTQNVTQANEGCDFAVLAKRDKVAEPDIF
jgi:dihydroxy-acid dehydratase